MINIRHVSDLAGLQLTKKEEVLYSKQLENVITFVSQLNEVDTKDVDLNKFHSDISNRMSKDETKSSLDVSSVLSNSDSTYNNFFRIDIVLKNKII